MTCISGLPFTRRGLPCHDQDNALFFFLFLFLFLNTQYLEDELTGTDIAMMTYDVT